MKIYIVGGAVRDFALGNTPKDIDYVVVGATRDELLSKMPSLSPASVGQDFPVFICKETGSEYAMARKERKTAAGYNGFEMDFDPTVTLESDLERRDLTINSMAAEALHSNLNVIKGLADPFGGMQDLKDKILRPVSDAFMEDPVRVLRLARLRARYGKEWKIAPEVLPMARKMAKSGELAALQPDRIQKELSRAMLEPNPRLFFDTLLEIDALHVIFPVLFRLKQTREAFMWHPEGDSYEHTMLVITAAREYANTPDEDYNLNLMFAALTHDLGKVLTPWDKQPAHHGHDMAGIALTEEFGNKYRFPAKMTERAMKTTRFHMRGHDLDKVKPLTVARMFSSMNVLNDPTVAQLLLDVFKADARGRLGFENETFENETLYKAFYSAYTSVKFADVFPDGQPKDKTKIKETMDSARAKAIQQVKKEMVANVDRI